jgi:predicted phage terminase large subunit-like protein
MTDASKRRYSEIQLLAALCRDDLLTFAQKAFEIVYPGKNFLLNWHHKAIAFELQQVIDGATRYLIINQPPRSLKSFFISVVLPAFMLGKNPAFTITCVSYSQDLSSTHATDFRKLVQSEWYRKLFNVPTPAKNTESEYKTPAGGFRYATSITGTFTGRGGDLVIIDDPLNATEAHSKASRQKVIDWYSGNAATRHDDKHKGAFIVVMQRLHEDDLTGHLLEEGGWRRLSLPAIAPADLTIQLPHSKSHLWRQGTAMDEVREPLPILEVIKRRLGTYNFNAQYLQEPLPATGKMLKDHWLRYVDVLVVPQPGDQIIQSWDTAMKAGDDNDYSVCETFRVRNKNEYYLIDVFRDRLEFPALVKKVVDLAGRFRANAVLIEDRVSGTSLIQEAKHRGVQGVIGVEPSADKLSRVMTQTPKLEAGSLILPRSAPWLADFVGEYLAFPGRYDDQMDALSQFLEWQGKREHDVFEFDF